MQNKTRWPWRPIGIVLSAAYIAVFSLVLPGCPNSDRDIRFAAAPLEVAGPAIVEPGKQVRIVSTALAADPESSLAELQAWMGRVDVLASFPEEATANVSRRLVLTESSWAMVIEFTPGQAGVYVVVIDWNDDSLPAAVHRVTVGSVPPSEPESPEPVAPVVAPPFSQAIYVYQRDDGAIPSGVMAALAKINELTEDAIAVPFEVDQRPIPERFAKAYKAGVEFGVPCLVVVRGDDAECVQVEAYEDVMEAVK